MKIGEYPEHAAIHEIAAPQREEPDDERNREEGDGEDGVGNRIQPDQFRLPQQALAMRGKHRHVENILSRAEANIVDT